MIFIYNFQHCNAHYSRNNTTSFIFSLVFFCVRTKMTKKHKKYVYLTVYELYTRQKYFSLRYFRIPKNICIVTKFVTLTALELVMAQNEISKFQWQPF